jgi:hypothetical protein
MQFRLIFSLKSCCANASSETGYVRSLSHNQLRQWGNQPLSGPQTSLTFPAQFISYRHATLSRRRLSSGTHPPIFRYRSQQHGRAQTGTDLPKVNPRPHIRRKPWPSTRCLHPLLALIQRDSSSNQIYQCGRHFWTSVQGGWGVLNSHSNGDHVCQCIRSGAGLLPFYLSLITPCPTINKHSCLRGKLLKRLHS